MMQIPEGWLSILTAIVTQIPGAIVGAIVGAYLAYRFARGQQRAKDKMRRIETVTRLTAVASPIVRECEIRLKQLDKAQLEGQDAVLAFFRHETALLTERDDRILNITSSQAFILGQRCADSWELAARQAQSAQQALRRFQQRVGRPDLLPPATAFRQALTDAHTALVTALRHAHPHAAPDTRIAINQLIED